MKPLAKKRLGQHFLNSIYIARKIVNFADIKEEVVIEIGAGKGMLTRELAKKARIVYAVEIDPECATILKDKALNNVKIINADFLDLNLKEYAGSVIVGNIPYSITTKIIEKLVKDRESFQKAFLTIQKEYGERLLAQPGSTGYSSITCYVNYYFNVFKGFVIPPSFFSPAPKVSSIVIGLMHKEPPFLLDDEIEFFNFIKGIFRYRRKILKNALINYFGSLLVELSHPILYKRPEQLHLNDFFNLYKDLKSIEKFKEQ